MIRPCGGLPNIKQGKEQQGNCCWVQVLAQCWLRAPLPKQEQQCRGWAVQRRTTWVATTPPALPGCRRRLPPQAAAAHHTSLLPPPTAQPCYPAHLCWLILPPSFGRHLQQQRRRGTPTRAQLVALAGWLGTSALPWRMHSSMHWHMHACMPRGEPITGCNAVATPAVLLSQDALQHRACGS